MKERMNPGVPSTQIRRWDTQQYLKAPIPLCLLGHLPSESQLFPQEGLP